MAKSKKEKKGKKAQGSGNGKSVIVGLILFICACAGWLLLKPSQVMVPSVIGKSEAEASQLIKASGLSVVIKTQETDQVDQDGKVLIQEPPSGTGVPKMSVVTLVVAKGPEGLTLPDLVGKTRSEAEDEILRLALKVEFQEARSETVPIGRVVSHKPAAGQKVARNGVVTLVISGGVGDIEVPDLSNLTVDEARAALDRLGLSLEVTQVAQDDFRDGDAVYVMRQEPAAGQTLSAGSRVTVFVPIAPPVGGGASPNGASASHAPRFEGMTVGAAKKLAAEQGVTLELTDSADDSRTITFQDPPPGDPLSGADAVVLIKVAESAVVPSLSGLNEGEARAQLEKAGLSVGTVKKSFGEVPGEILEQRPRAGIETVAGSSVDLIVSDPQAPPSSAQGPAPTPGFTPAPWVE